MLKAVNWLRLVLVAALLKSLVKMQTKACNKCSVEKPIHQFSKSKQGKFGVRSHCKVCDSVSQKLQRANRKDEMKEYNKTWAKNNRPKKLAASKNWIASNYDKVLSYNSARRSKQRRATLYGYSKEIEQIYWLARDLRTITGENYQVDHIVPLNGKDVCGLHVPWNLQILPADLNMSKGNRLTLKEMV
jgi:hypothetical protein